jgi:hypothetical protein
MVTRKIGDSVILIPNRTNGGDLQCIFSLNEVGSFIWSQIDGKRTVPEIVEAVCSEFEADRQEVEHDVSDFLAQMKEIGAVALNLQQDRKTSQGISF